MSKDKTFIYKSETGKIKLKVNLEDQTIWLNQKQISQLFGTKRPAITKHLSNIFKSKELKENSVCSILEHTAKDGKKYNTKFYKEKDKLEYQNKLEIKPKKMRGVAHRHIVKGSYSPW